MTSLMRVMYVCKGSGVMDTHMCRNAIPVVTFSQKHITVHIRAI